MNIPVTSTLIFNPKELASHIEEKFKEYLIPFDKGIYIRGKSDAVLRPGNYYYKKEKKEDGTIVETPIMSLSDIVSEVFNQSGDIVVTSKNVKQLSEEPTVPTIGMQIIKAFVQKTLDDKSAWLNVWLHRDQASYEEIWREFIKPEYHNDETLNDIVNNIVSTLVDLRTNIIKFIDKDTWLMHFLKVNRGDYYIEKCCDFRIWDWQRRITEGEWS
jgi:hypothetical protein